MEPEEIPYIPEADFSQDLEAGLNELAAAVARSGLSLSAIARGARCHWETVYHAANGIPVRYDNARRIVYYLRHLNENQQLE